MHSILIIEDDRDVAELQRHLLADAGFAVDLIADGAEGLRRVLERAPDLLVLDLNLPNLDGLEILRRLRGESRLAGLPVLVFTAADDETDGVVGLELGADEYMAKPFSNRELVARVRALLRRRASREELVLRITDGKGYIVDRNIDVHISTIRRKLGDQARLILTVRGVGYKCADRVSAR